MATSFVSMDLKELRHSKAYGILAATILPRPIAFVSTVSNEGRPNLAPFSFFMAGGSNPPSLVFCPVLRPDGQPKDTLRNIEANGEFVVNLVTRSMSVEMNEASFDYPHDVNEWEVSNFTPLQSEVVRPARVAESKVQFECRKLCTVSLAQENPFGPLQTGPDVGDGTIFVIGEVVRFHLDEGLWDRDAERVLTERFLPIARLGASRYVDLDGPEIFELARPKQAKSPR